VGLERLDVDPEMLGPPQPVHRVLLPALLIVRTGLGGMAAAVIVEAEQDDAARPLVDADLHRPEP
jgi:hypothetical protein